MEEFVEAWGTLDENGNVQSKKQQDLLRYLQGQGLDAADLATITHGLEVVAQICARSVATGEDKVKAQSRTAAVIRGAWLSALEERYLRVLVGEPVFFLEDVKDVYISGHGDLYIQAELYARENLERLTRAARDSKDFLKNQVNQAGQVDQFDTTIGKLVTNCLTPICAAMREDMVDRYRALKAYAALRADQLDA